MLEMNEPLPNSLLLGLRSTPDHRNVIILCFFSKLTLRFQTQIKVGWWTTGALFLATIVGPAPMGNINYVYNAYHAAIYAALGPMAWCALFAWIVFTSHLGYTSECSFGRGHFA